MAGYPENKREKISDPFSAEMCNVICSGNFFSWMTYFYMILLQLSSSFVL